MVDRKIIEEWLDKADEDFQFASTAIDEGNEFYAQLCFHFQQSAEKYLKSFLIYHNQELRKVHSLKHLLRLCCRIDKTLSDLTESCDALEDYYIETRYPVHWPSKITQKDANEAVKAAGTIRQKMIDLLILRKK